VRLDLRCAAELGLVFVSGHGHTEWVAPSLAARAARPRPNGRYVPIGRIFSGNPTQMQWLKEVFGDVATLFAFLLTEVRVKGTLPASVPAHALPKGKLINFCTSSHVHFDFDLALKTQLVAIGGRNPYEWVRVRAGAGLSAREAAATRGGEARARLTRCARPPLPRACRARAARVRRLAAARRPPPRRRRLHEAAPVQRAARRARAPARAALLVCRRAQLSARRRRRRRRRPCAAVARAASRASVARRPPSGRRRASGPQQHAPRRASEIVVRAISMSHAYSILGDRQSYVQRHIRHRQVHLDQQHLLISAAAARRCNYIVY
jgi:hypothetical protein